MYSIQVFWLSIVAPADRIAIWPAPPICRAISSISTRPMFSATEGEMSRSRPSALTLESQEMTLMPFSLAVCSTLTTPAASLAEMAMASTPCWM